MAWLACIRCWPRARAWWLMSSTTLSQLLAGWSSSSRWTSEVKLRAMRRGSPPVGTLALDEPCEERELLLLQLHQLEPLNVPDFVEFDMQRGDFHFGLGVHVVVVLRVEAIAGGLAVLAHHDDRRLQRRKARQDEIQQNERVRIEPLVHPRVDQHPQADPCDREADERPAAAEGGDLIGHALPKSLLVDARVRHRALAVD